MLLEGHLARFLELLHGPDALDFLFSAELATLALPGVLVHVGEAVKRLHLLLQSVVPASHQVFEL